MLLNFDAMFNWKRPNHPSSLYHIEQTHSAIVALFSFCLISLTWLYNGHKSYCISLYFRVFFTSRFCDFWLIRDFQNSQCITCFLFKLYVFILFARILNSRWIKFANISKNKVLATFRELPVAVLRCHYLIWYYHCLQTTVLSDERSEHDRLSGRLSERFWKELDGSLSNIVTN